MDTAATHTSYFSSIQADTISSLLGIQTTAGKQAWLEGLQAWPRSTQELAARSSSFRLLQEKRELLPSAEEFSQIAKLEEKVEPLLRTESAVESESYSQVCFRGSPWSQLNSIPFALFLLSFYKSWVLPAFTICMPFFLVVAVYILMIQWNPTLTEVLPLTKFLELMWKMWMGSGVEGFSLPGMPSLPSPFTQSSNAASAAGAQLKQIFQYGWILFTVVQNIWQPLQQAYHFRTLDHDCLEVGEAIVALEKKGVEWSRTWSAWWPQWGSRWCTASESGGDPRRAFAWAIESPFWLRHLLRAFGRFEALACLAKQKTITNIRVLQSKQPEFFHGDLYDPALAVENAIKSSLHLGGYFAQHAVVTGPNRGGKSSALRASLTALVMGHTYGAVFSDAGNTGKQKPAMTYFSWIADGLRLEDAPGKMSMFEKEVAFAQSILVPHKGHGFVVYDECFHSTNPTDSMRTSSLFCSRLWRDPRCISIISTHLYDLAQSAPSSVQKICVPARRLSGATFQFSYSLQPGICMVSSVDGLLKQYGFFRSNTPRKEESKENPAVNKNELAQR